MKNPMRESRDSDGEFSWKQLEQAVEPSSISPESQVKRKQHQKRALVVAGLVFASVILIGGGYWLVSQPETSSVGIGEPIEKIDFKTNGKITERWLNKKVDLPYGVSLMQLDMFGLKTRIEGIPQVKAVQIERHFPNKLSLEVKEHQPLLKIMLEDEAKKALWLISEEGVLYRPSAYPKKQIELLPYVSEIALKKKDEGGFQPLSNVDGVRQLMVVAREHYPELYKQWKSFSLKHLNAHGPAAYSYIKVKTQTDVDVLFGLEDPENQLKRLKVIYDYYGESRRRPLEMIDLSMKNKQAAVKFKRHV